MLEMLTSVEVVSLYNVFARQNGSQTVKKFRDVKTGHSRLQDISRGLDRKIVLAAMKKAAIPADKIKKLPTEPKIVAVPEAPAPEPIKAAPPVKKVDAIKVLAEETAKENARHSAETKKEDAKMRKELKLNEGTLEVIKAIREHINGNEQGEVSTTLIAKKLKTSTTAVCRAAEKLAKEGLIKLEDDSPDDDNRLYYITLTRAGCDFRHTPVKKQKLAIAEPTTPSKPKKSLPAERPGPASNKSGKKLYKLVDGNPRRIGTHGYKSFELIKNGMSYEDYKAAGGRNNDLAWDIDKGFVELR